MKIASNKTGLYLRLGAVAAALLFGQQALAAGTRAGTDITNTVSVDYFVGGIDQTDIPASVTFVVDRRVDYTLTLEGGALVEVSPGQNDAFFDIRLTNTSNSVLDFSIVLDQAGVTTVRGVADTADMTNPEYAVSADFVADTAPAQGGPQWVDELPADEDVLIRVWGDAALSLLNGQVAGIAVQTTAGEPGGVGVEGAVLDYTAAADDTTVQNVDANGNDGEEVAIDGFIVLSADLTVTKAAAYVSDPLLSGLAVPGAVYEYTITIVNASTTTAADTVTITDTMSADVTLALAAVNGSDIEVDNNGVVTACTASDADADGCALTAGVLTFNGLTIAADTTLVITYRVSINDPLITP